LDIYNEVLQADNLQQNGHAKQAAAKYLEAQTALKKLKEEQTRLGTPKVVSFRLDYVAEQLQALAKGGASSARACAAGRHSGQDSDRHHAATEISGLQEQIRSLTAANAELENKLKEALSVQPAAVSPRELAKAEEKVIALQKEKDLLASPSNSPKPPSRPPRRPRKRTKPPAQLAEANQALADLKARSSQESAKAAQAETDQLKGSLADAQKKDRRDDVQIALKGAGQRRLKGHRRRTRQIERGIGRPHQGLGGRGSAP
jgi:hypothetical protein